MINRIVKKRDKRVVEYGDNLRDHLENVNIVHVRQPSYENETNEMRENQSRDHENYALVEPSEKCYEDLPPGEYDLLRSQRKHKMCLSGSCEEPNYDQVHKGGGMYDIAGQVHTEVLQSDYEYEMIKNMKKTNTLNKESGISNKHGYTEYEEAMQIRSWKCGRRILKKCIQNYIFNHLWKNLSPFSTCKPVTITKISMRKNIDMVSEMKCGNTWTVKKCPKAVKGLRC